METECKANPLSFQAAAGREVVASFDGGTVSSDAGMLLIREADRRTGILDQFTKCFRDFRDGRRVEHSLTSMLSQRVYGIALGYEDLADHDQLRRDPLLATVVGSSDPVGANRSRARDRGAALCGKSTLSRLELSSRASAPRARYKKISAEPLEIDSMMVGIFLKSSEKAPREIVIDMDTTDDPVHGAQEGRHFSAYYGHYCFLPLYFFSEGHVLLSRLLPGNADQRKAALPELSRIVRQIRAKWPLTRLIIRGDSGFCSDEIMSWCEGNGVDYVLGLAKNSRLVKMLTREMRKAERRFIKTRETQRIFRDMSYKTRRSWSRRRRVVAKAEHMAGGANPRFVVTSLRSTERDARNLYEDLYCQRGDMENRIKEQQLDMFADRTSAGSLEANQLRLYFASVAYMLMHALRRLALQGTQFAKAQCGTIRLKLLKIGATVRVTVRKIWVTMPTSYPWVNEFMLAHAALLRQ
jgi:hypothetical protein